MKIDYQSAPIKSFTLDSNSKLKKLRKAGFNPNYWYAFEYERAVKNRII